MKGGRGGDKNLVGQSLLGEMFPGGGKMSNFLAVGGGSPMLPQQGKPCFLWMGLTASRQQSHYKEMVYFLPQGFYRVRWLLNLFGSYILYFSSLNWQY